MSRILQELFEETWRQDYHIGVHPDERNKDATKKHNTRAGKSWFVMLLARALEPDVMKGGNRGR